MDVKQICYRPGADYKSVIGPAGMITEITALTGIRLRTKIATHYDDFRSKQIIALVTLHCTYYFPLIEILLYAIRFHRVLCVHYR